MLALALVVRRNELEALDQGLDAVVAMVARHPPDLTSSDVLGEVCRLVAMRRGHEAVRPLVDQLLTLAGDIEPWRSNVAVHAVLAASLAGDDATVASFAGAAPDDETRSRFLGLVVDAHTHKEIGAALFISAKTVEHHVAHIRTKLGVSTRAEMLSTLRAGFGLGD